MKLSRALWALGHKSLSVVPLSCLYGTSFSLQDLPWAPKDGFKLLLIREGRRCRAPIRKGPSRDKSAAWRQGPSSPSRTTHSSNFVFLCRRKTLNKWTTLTPWWSILHSREEDCQNQPKTTWGQLWRRMLASTLILLRGPVFHFKTWRPTPILFQRKVQSLGH